MSELARRSLDWKAALTRQAIGLADEHADIPAMRAEDV